MVALKRKPTQSAIFLVILGIIIVWLIFVFFQERRLHTRTEKLKLKHISLQQKLDNINDLLEHGPRPMTEADLVLNGSGQVYAYLYETARRSNMSMEKVVILPITTNALKTVIPAEITLGGSYPAMLIFIDRLAQNNLLGNVKQIEISGAEGAQNNSLVMSISLSLPISKEVRP